MYEITAGENNTFRIPALDFRGTPLGIDIRKVVQTGICPAISTGIAHKNAGIGQIGAGLTAAPMECFTIALEAFAAKRQAGGHSARRPKSAADWWSADQELHDERDPRRDGHGCLGGSQSAQRL